MRKFLVFLGVIAAVLTIILSFLPLGTITMLPALVTIIVGILAFMLSKSANKNLNAPKFIIIAGLLASFVTISKVVFFENKVAKDEQFELREQESEQKAVEELEELEEELDELEGLEE
ncbi:hypothetical protein ACFQ1M_05610 [Sungkyunkwania multivorans]|uniref:FUSC family protein n=1 Tax=Sungkyunkwania multivorans TaxID=1173618 RepID=A0ABW3CVB9_9FLAO